MKPALTFLIAARRCEIDELERLARTSALVGAIAELVHALQRERGLSNVYLASGGTRFAEARQAQVATAERCAQLPEVPTLTENGIPLRAAARRGFILSRDVEAIEAEPDTTARLALTAARALHMSGGDRALATMCVGVGQGSALALAKA